LGEQYHAIAKGFIEMGYKEGDFHEQTMVTMMELYKTGVKIMQKDSGDSSFKELGLKVETDTYGKSTDIKLTKCK